MLNTCSAKGSVMTAKQAPKMHPWMHQTAKVHSKSCTWRVKLHRKVHTWIYSAWNGSCFISASFFLDSIMLKGWFAEDPDSVFVKLRGSELCTQNLPCSVIIPSGVLRLDGSQGKMQVWHPPCSKMRFFESECTVLKKILVTLLELFLAP